MKDAALALGTCTHIYSMEGKVVAREIPGFYPTLAAIPVDPGRCMLSPEQHLSPQRSRQKAWALTHWGSWGACSAAQIQISKYSLHRPSQPSSVWGTLQQDVSSLCAERLLVVVAEWNAIWISWWEGLGMAEGPPAQADGWVFRLT